MVSTPAARAASTSSWASRSVSAMSTRAPARLQAAEPLVGMQALVQGHEHPARRRHRVVALDVLGPVLGEDRHAVTGRRDGHETTGHATDPAGELGERLHARVRDQRDLIRHPAGGVVEHLVEQHGRHAGPSTPFSARSTAPGAVQRAENGWVDGL